MRARPTGTSQRYGLTHFHPGQIRNAYPKHNQADQARVIPDRCRWHRVTARTSRQARIVRAHHANVAQGDTIGRRSRWDKLSLLGTRVRLGLAHIRS